VDSRRRYCVLIISLILSCVVSAYRCIPAILSKPVVCAVSSPRHSRLGSLLPRVVDSRNMSAVSASLTPLMKSASAACHSASLRIMLLVAGAE
jgi:hypothetical protein